MRVCEGVCVCVFVCFDFWEGLSVFYVDSLSTFVTTVFFFLTNEKQSLSLNILLLTQSFLSCVVCLF